MTALAPYAAVIVLMAAVVLWSTRQQWRTVALYGALAALALFGGVDVLGTAKPAWVEWRELDGGEVVATHYVPGEAIYVVVAGEPPRFYAVPWNTEQARKMQDAERRKRKLRFDPDGGDQVIYPLPQFADPPK